MMKSENKQRSSENLGIFGTFLLIFSFFALLGPIHGNPNGRSFVYQEAQDQAELSFNLSAIHEALDFFTENIMKAKSNSTSTQSRRLLPEEPKFYRAGDNIPDEFDDFPCSFRADEKAHRCAVDCEGDSLNCLPAMKWYCYMTWCARWRWSATRWWWQRAAAAAAAWPCSSAGHPPPPTGRPPGTSWRLPGRNGGSGPSAMQRSAGPTSLPPTGAAGARCSAA
ncbi:unnamed protein product, partial [Heterosigma akashiwo]